MVAREGRDEPELNVERLPVGRRPMPEVRSNRGTVTDEAMVVQGLENLRLDAEVRMLSQQSF